MCALALAVAAGCGGSKSHDDATTGDDGGGGDGGSDARDLPDAAVATCTPRNGTTVTLAPVASNLDDALLVAGAPGDPRLFVIQQPGNIRVIKDGQLLATPFLDLSGAAGPVRFGGERGLLGIAFHPDFRQNDRFYVHFDRKSDGASVIAEYLAVPGGDTADPDSRRDVLVVPQPYSNHNGGMIEFGNDGMLYIALGDGGSGGDPQDRAQDDRELLGKLLRIDVDTRTGTKPYGIPADNPFASSPDGAGDPRPEIWHKGLRNPFRFSFDRQTGDVYIGDVGQGPNPPGIEEIDAAANLPLINWGWDDREGNRCFEPATNCLTAGRTEPVSVHSASDNWHAIIGGQVYRGTCFPDLAGTYFYGDYSAGQLWAFELVGGVAQNDRQVLSGLGNITSIHADSLGELYVTTANGLVRRIEVQ